MNAPVIWPTAQDEFPLRYDPATGKALSDVQRASEYRHYHGGVAWLYNPWNGVMRNAYDIGSDVHGHAIVASFYVVAPQTEQRRYDPSRDDVPFDFRYDPKTGATTFKADGFPPVNFSVPFSESYDLFKLLKEVFQRASK